MNKISVEGMLWDFLDAIPDDAKIDVAIISYATTEKSEDGMEMTIHKKAHQFRSSSPGPGEKVVDEVEFCLSLLLQALLNHAKEVDNNDALGKLKHLCFRRVASTAIFNENAEQMLNEFITRAKKGGIEGESLRKVLTAMGYTG